MAWHHLHGESEMRGCTAGRCNLQSFFVRAGMVQPKALEGTKGRDIQGRGEDTRCECVVAGVCP